VSNGYGGADHLVHCPIRCIVQFVALAVCVIFVMKLASALSDLMCFSVQHTPMLLFVQLAGLSTVSIWLFKDPGSSIALACGAALFAVFADVSRFEAYRGLNDCDCIPGIRLTPATTRVFDVFAAFIHLGLSRRASPIGGSHYS